MNISTGIPLNIGAGSAVLARIGQAANDVNTAVQKQELIDLQEVDPDVFTNEVDYNPEYDGLEGEHRLNYQYTNTMNPYPNSTFPNTNIQFPNSFSPYL